MSTPPKKPQRATIRDVAEQAGVSISTVSHVFSGGRPISAKTQQHVRDVARRLNYRAHPSAQSLRMSRTGIIGLIIRPRDAIAGSRRGTMTFTRLMGALAAYTLEHGRGLIHVPDILDPSVAQVPMDVCIVAHPYGRDEVLAQLLAQDSPVVTIDIDPDQPDYPWSVFIDYATPLREVLDAAYAQGARNVLFLSGTEDNAWNRSTIETYRAWCHEHDLTARHRALFEGAPQSDVAALIDAELRAAPRPDAIISGTSSAAATILRVATEHGLSCPEDLLLAALTDSEYTRSTTPAITALDLRMEDSAVLGVDLAIRLADGQAPPDVQPRHHPQMIWRSTLPRAHGASARS